MNASASPALRRSTVKGQIPMSNSVKQRQEDAKRPEQKREEEQKLDDAIADSMIASDPPASVSKGKPTAPARKKPLPEDKKGN
jgi:hypothetical protein